MYENDGFVVIYNYKRILFIIYKFFKNAIHV